MTTTRNEPTHLDLFSGIGGFALACRWAGFRTIGFCEIDKYCHRILRKNFGALVRGKDCGWCGKSTHRRFYQIGDHLVCGYCKSVAYTVGAIKLREGETKLEVEQNALDRRKWSQASNGFSADSPTIFGDIRLLSGIQYQGVSLITGGFPCQPFSVAGKRGGAADDRAIWPQMFRIIKEAQPDWIVAENVAGLTTMVEHNLFPPVGCDGCAEGEVGATFDRTGRGYLEEILESLESIGYAVAPIIVPACAVDARHRRDRVWIVGRNISNSTDNGSHRNDASGGDEGAITTDSQQQRYRGTSRIERFRSDVPNPADGRLQESQHQSGCEERQRDSTAIGTFTADYCRWSVEPDVGRVAHGVPSRVDRLKGLGNAIVPQVAYEILRAIREEMDGRSAQ